MSKKNGSEIKYLLAPLYDEDGVQASSGIGVDGKEYPDPVPMAPPIGYTPPQDLMTMIRQMIRAEDFRKKLESEGVETFEEADDFDIEDDPLDPLTVYEKIFYPADERSAPGSNVKAGPQAGVTAPLEVKQEAKKPVDGSEGAVSSPPPVSSEKAA